nr:hypothetical protein [Tanacetum cinerariifolium]
MTTPRLAPFPATTLYAGVFTLFVIVSNSDDEITTLLVRPIPTSSDHPPTLYGFPLDSGEHLLDEDLSETAEITPHSDYFGISYPLTILPTITISTSFIRRPGKEIPMPS